MNFTTGEGAAPVRESGLKSLWRVPSAKEMAARELAQAERSLLEAQSIQEYTTQMVAYHKARIARLRQYIAAQAGA